MRSTYRDLILTFALCLFVLSVPGCRPNTPRPNGAPATAAVDGTEEMARTLREVAESIDPREMPYIVNEKRAEIIRKAMDTAANIGQYRQMRFAYAKELLNAGKSEQALTELGELAAEIKQNNPDIWPSLKPHILLWQGIASLRFAEDQNCCASNTPDSCLLPIKGQGLHTRREGSTRAMAFFVEILKDNPEDLQARWLLNIAAMTLGGSPQGVPAKWVIPPKVFQSDYALPRFTNVSSFVGLNILGRSGGAIVDDLDGDGFLDAMVSAIGFEDQLNFYRNNGDGTFTDRTKEAKLTGLTGGLNLVQGDYDNDGFTDFVVLRGGWMGKWGKFPLSLIRNNGDGTFTDVTRRAGVFRAGPTQTATWLDYNNDGKLDLCVGWESGSGGTYPCALYHNNGNGTFTDVAAKAGVDHVGYVKGVVSGDIDNDGWPDLHMTMSGATGGENALYRNNRDGTFTNIASSAGVTGQKISFSTFWFDYDNDGRQDIFTIGYRAEGVQDVAADYLGKPTSAERSHLYRNNGNGTFSDVSRAARVDKVLMGMGINYGDLDNDGWLDFYVGTGTPGFDMVVPNRMFRNAGGKFFQDVTTSGNFGHLQKGHAIAFADMNNDGNQDIFSQMGGANFGDVAYTALYANPIHDNRWLTLKLEGVQTNRSAIGARIKVTVNTPSGKRDIYKVVCSGGSFGASPLRQEIGLGKATGIDQVEIFWPVSQKRQVLRGLAMDRFYAVREDKEQAEPLDLRSFKWPGMKVARR